MFRKILTVITAIIITAAFSACSYFMPSEAKVIAPELRDSEEVVMPSLMIRKGDLALMYDISGSFVPEPSKLYTAEVGINGTVSNIFFSIGESVNKGDLVMQLNTEAINDKIHIQEINVEKLRLAQEQNIVLYETGKTDKYSLELSRLSLEAAENYLSDLKEDLSYHYIYAPDDGVIVFLNFDVGDYAFGEAVGISRVDNGIFEVLIDSGNQDMNDAEAEIISMEIGEPLVIIYEGVEYEGEIIRDYSTYHVEFGFDASYNHIHIKTEGLPDDIGFNKPVTVRNIVEEAIDAVVIPMNAVYTPESNPYTYVIVGEEFQKRYIELGMSDGVFYEVISGLEPGENILKIN